MNIKYIFLLLIIFGFIACNDDEEIVIIPPIELDPGAADFSKFVALGSSTTAGFTDFALFMAAQENSMPNLMAQQFSLIGGGNFSQPLTNDNIGGLLFEGNVMQPPRLYFDGSGPALLPKTPTTEVTQVLSGSFNNMGVVGAKSYHLLAPGYGNLAGVPLGLANPYFARFASSAGTSVLADAMAQSPSFFSLWIGSNDVLGYAISGGNAINQEGNFDPSTYGSNDITDPTVFAQVIGALITTLTSGGAKGVVGNIPDIVSLPYFTAVPYDPVPLDALTAAALNQGYAAYNGGLLQIEGLGLITAEEREDRTINFMEGDNAVVIEDETLTDLSAYGLPSYRHATPEDLLVLPGSVFIGTTVGGNPLLINGVSVPLADKWVLIPSEQEEVKTATDAFNIAIKAAASQAGLAFVDANSLTKQLATTGVSSGDFILTSELVLGGAFGLDGVHPTARGYATLANEFLKAIDETYGSNFEEAGALNDIGDYPTNYNPALQ